MNPQATAAAQPQATVLALGPELTIAFAANAYEALAGVLNSHAGDLALELDGVTEFDSAGVQLLLAARNSQARRGHRLLLRSASPAVADALNTFGLQSLLPTHA